MVERGQGFRVRVRVLGGRSGGLISVGRLWF